MGYDAFEKLCESRGVTPYRVSKETGISTSTISSWKTGRYTPKRDKLQKIADFFGVSVDYLNGVPNSGQVEGYYVDEEAAEYAQAIFEDPDLRALFHAVKGIRKEDQKLLVNMALRFKETNPDG